MQLNSLSSQSESNQANEYLDDYGNLSKRVKWLFIFIITNYFLTHLKTAGNKFLFLFH